MGTGPTLKMLPLPVCLTQTKRKGVQFIRQARQAFDREEDVRKFVPLLINFLSPTDSVIWWTLTLLKRQSHQ